MVRSSSPAKRIPTSPPERTWFRLHPREDDPERLLDPERQRSEPWGGTVFGRCPKCGGEGRTMHECESCRHGADPSCPSCGGRMRYLAECPACAGTGEVDDTERDGVSVFPEEDGLYRYMLRRDADIEDAQLLELEGEPTGDDDFDADEGALLIRPRRVAEVREPDRARIESLRER
jgi:DnaJ-class molecular chaperone